MSIRATRTICQCTLSGRTIPDAATALLRETHQGVLDGTLRPRVDIGKYFYQRRLVTVA